MTTETLQPDQVVAAPAEPVVPTEPRTDDAERRRPSIKARFLVAFVIAAVAVGAVGVGAIYAYEQQHLGLVLPGVRIGSVDLSGVDRPTAIARLQEAYGGLAAGKVVVTASVASLTIPYEQFGRRADIEAMADAALGVGRVGTPIERAVAEVRTAFRGVALEPWVTYDAPALAAIVERRLDGISLEPIDATITMTERGMAMTPARWGRSFDAAAVTTAAMERLDDLDAPAELVFQAALTPIRPAFDDTDVQIAASVAQRVSDDVALTAGDDEWTVTGGAIAQTISFTRTGDERYEPTIDRVALEAALAAIAADAEIKPVNASFLVGRNGAVVGVTPARDGRTLDVTATADRLQAALAARAAGQEAAPVAPALVALKPELTTEEAQKAAPLMTRISTWTTYFPISEKNYYGANIWIPSSIINGYVLGPGETFDFWRAVGTISRAKGYGMGGAIINGRTQPTGALAGGICSCSTTLFNAAARAGLKMGMRDNHYYYIDRYPLGLDATVAKTGGRIVQNVTFTNDTANPILIRGINTRDGGAGYVRFDLYSVPTGRTVSFSRPTVRNVRPATTVIQYTSSLRPGARRQIEWPSAGKQVWVTRTVRERNGRVIHQDTWYSDYKRVDGIILVGR
jgi:vancomycin resistance protein YoaR